MAAESTGRRILDYLNDGEELGVEGPAVAPRATARSLLPRFRWARLARLGRKGGGGGKGQQQQEEEEIVVEKVELKSLGASACATADGDTRPSDLGVGLSLVFLLAKTSDEFNKMAKVRAEMETLLKEFKGQVIRNNGDGDDDVSRARNLESAASSCLTDGNEKQIANAHSEDQVVSSSMEVASCKRMDVLEEEFHAELERLHVNYGSDTPPFLPEEHDAAEPSDDDIADYRQGFSSDFGEDVEEEDAEDDDDDAEYNGVSAVQLERRLHELLHQRNQQRIEELEVALRRAEKKLVEKEMEACMWKDTAKLPLRQDDDESR